MIHNQIHADVKNSLKHAILSMQDVIRPKGVATPRLKLCQSPAALMNVPDVSVKGAIGKMTLAYCSICKFLNADNETTNSACFKAFTAQPDLHNPNLVQHSIKHKLYEVASNIVCAFKPGCSTLSCRRAMRNSTCQPSTGCVSAFC